MSAKRIGGSQLDSDQKQPDIHSTKAGDRRQTGRGGGRGADSGDYVEYNLDRSPYPELTNVIINYMQLMLIFRHTFRSKQSC